MPDPLPGVCSSPPPPHASGLPTSAIIGIAVGSVLAVVLAGAALAAALLRRPRHAGPAPAPPPSLQPGYASANIEAFPPGRVAEGSVHLLNA